jgi:hypothetical protein
MAEHARLGAGKVSETVYSASRRQFARNQSVGLYSAMDMKSAILYLSLLLLLVVLTGALRTIFERKFPFIRKLCEETRQSYMVLAIAAASLLVRNYVDLRRVQSFEIAGVKATLTEVQQKVGTLSDQVEELFKRKKIEVFDSHNWTRVRRVSGTNQHFTLEVTLELPPIPGSVEVYEGVLLMPEQKYEVDDRVIRFPASADDPELGLTIKYYPRLVAAGRGAQQ